MLNVDEFYDPHKDPLIAAFSDLGDRFAGVILAAEMRDDRYGRGQVPVIILQPDEAFEDEEPVAVYARSSQMQREIGKKARQAKRKAVTPGDWISIEFAEVCESAAGNEWKRYEVKYEARGPESASAAGEFDQPPY